MIRKIITPRERTFTLEMPESFVGKKVEILVFEVEEGDKPLEYTDEDKIDKLNRLNKSLEGYKVDLSNFSFDREEANDYQ